MLKGGNSPAVLHASFDGSATLRNLRMVAGADLHAVLALATRLVTGVLWEADFDLDFAALDVFWDFVWLDLFSGWWPLGNGDASLAEAQAAHLVLAILYEWMVTFHGLTPMGRRTIGQLTRI